MHQNFQSDSTEIPNFHDVSTFIFQIALKEEDSKKKKNFWREEAQFGESSKTHKNCSIIAFCKRIIQKQNGAGKCRKRVFKTFKLF